MRVGVVSDIHANVWALERALASLNERGVDRLVVLGDVLTYGPAVLETLSTLAGRTADFLVGNHDQLYFDLDDADTTYFDTMPDWIKESARDTHRKLNDARLSLAVAFDWQDEVVVDGVLFTHANPYGAGDWRYLNSDADAAAAADVVAKRNLRAVVVGHTHRVRTGGSVLNPGSVGQPRNADKSSSCGIVTIEPDRVELEVVPIDYDVAAYVEATKRNALSAPSQEQVLRYMGAA